MKATIQAALVAMAMASHALHADDIPVRPLEESPARTVQWQVLASARMATVSVENALYEQAGSQFFFVKVRIENKAAMPIFVDLNSYWQVIHPNQWGVLLGDHRGEINESRSQIAPLDQAQSSQVIGAFKANRLTKIPKGGSLEYLREFNRSGRKDVEAQIQKVQEAKFVFVSMDGQLLLTDGSNVEQVSLSWDQPKESGAGIASKIIRSDVLLPLPIVWKEIPKDTIVIGRNG